MGPLGLDHTRLFWPGVAGQFMTYLPAKVIVSLTASLLMALVFVPIIGSLFPGGRSPLASAATPRPRSLRSQPAPSHRPSRPCRGAGAAGAGERVRQLWRAVQGRELLSRDGAGAGADPDPGGRQSVGPGDGPARAPGGGPGSRQGGRAPGVRPDHRLGGGAAGSKPGSGCHRYPAGRFRRLAHTRPGSGDSGSRPRSHRRHPGPGRADRGTAVRPRRGASRADRDILPGPATAPRGVSPPAGSYGAPGHVPGRLQRRYRCPSRKSACRWTASRRPATG